MFCGLDKSHIFDFVQTLSRGGLVPVLFYLGHRGAGPWCSAQVPGEQEDTVLGQQSGAGFRFRKTFHVALTFEIKIDQQTVGKSGRTKESEKKRNLRGTFKMYIVAHDSKSLNVVHWC